MIGSMSVVFFAFMLVGLFLLTRWINVLNEYERGVIFRLGRLVPAPRARVSCWCRIRSTRW